ncbi:MAG TPA: hypothetical protein VF800_02780 [Telluria sp.]|jgi:hypothetical protein
MNTTSQDAALSKKALSLAILAELRKHTDLLTTLCRHQDDAATLADGAMRFAPNRTASPMPRRERQKRQEVGVYDPVLGVILPPQANPEVA